MSEPWQRHRRPLPPLSFTLNSLPISHQRHTPFLSGRFNLATMFSLWGSDCSPSLHSLTQSASVAVSLLCTVHLYGLRRPGVSSTGKWTCNNSQGGKAWPPRIPGNIPAVLGRLSSLWLSLAWAWEWWGGGCGMGVRWRRWSGNSRLWSLPHINKIPYVYTFPLIICSKCPPCSPK